MNAALADRILDVLTTPHRRIGASVMRALLGSAIALFYLQNLGWRRFLWGPEGLVPASYAPELVAKHGSNLYLLSSSLPFFENIFWSGLLAAFAFACGRWVPFSTIACAIFTWCLIARDSFVGDSGWTLATLLLFYAVALDCGGYLIAGRPLAAPGAASQERGLTQRAGALLHNFGVALVLWQISLLYASACFYKVTGHKWQDGTALYYILRSNQFNLTALGAHVYFSAILVAIATYSTLLLQAAFPFCIWQRPAKYIVAIGAIGFHLGIAYCMALPLFSLVMIACEAMLFSDADYRAAARAMVAIRTSIATAWRANTLEGAGATNTATLIFDADCGMCARFAGSRLVKAARLEPTGYQFIAGDAALTSIVRERGFDERVFATAMVVIADDRIDTGARAFNTILRRRGGWPGVCGMLLSLPILAHLEGVIYRAIASHRQAISRHLGTPACAPPHVSG